MKVKDTIKKVGAVAGSAVMVGMTLGAAQSLADFPQPFVGDDGTVASQVVVGSSGKQADVIGAINVAAALGQEAIQTETRTATAAVSGGSFGWSASDGATLDTRNDNLFFGDALNNVRETLTSQHVSSLEDVTFTDDAGTSVDIEYFLYPGSNAVQFDQHQDSDDDPVLYVDNDAITSSTSGHLFRVSANLGDTVTFNSSDVEGMDINLFGEEYEVSEDTDGDTLVLFGSSQSVSLSTSGATSGTVTVDGTEHTIEIDGVNSGGVIYRVDEGSWEQKTDGSTFTIDGETVRIDNVIDRVDDAGSADFKIGSEELHLEDGAVIEDGDNNDYDGTHVEFTGTGVGAPNTPLDIDTIDLYVGAEDDDMEYVPAGGSYSHSLFEDYVFHLGGLNPDAGDGASDVVSEIAVEQSTTETIQVSFTDDGGDDAALEFFHRDTANDVTEFADDDGETIHVVEGANVTEDEYFVTDAGGFAHMWQVTGVDRDATTGHTASDEATFTIQDVVSGNSVDVDLDWDGNAYQGTEIIDGVSYSFEADGSLGFFAAWGDGSDVDNGAYGANDLDLGDETTVYPALDDESGASVALTEAVDYETGVSSADDTSALMLHSETLTLPSTESSSEKSVLVTVGDTETAVAGDADAFNLTVGGETVASASNPTVGESISVDHAVGQTLYTFNATVTGTGPVTIDLQAGVDVDQNDDNNDGVTGPSVLVIESEDDNDEEHAYVVAPTWDGSSDDEAELNGVTAYTNAANRETAGLESDSDVTEGYDFYGTHTIDDSDDPGSVTFHVPDGQAAAGAGFTAPGGSLDAGGGAGSASVEYEAIAGVGMLPDMGMLDTEVTDSVRQSSHLILVGGPAVNTLVADLAEANDGVWSQQDWIDNGEDSARLNVVADAFSQGNYALIVAGYGADDTRAAARYISNYADHEQELSDAGTSMTLTSADYMTN